ncbi:hypothetical protein [Methanobrevibacter arboriphilus]|uniref:Uncharacterized protein n=1 Tax=Methanobrevibacter arboriphilus TaxID=39441 RepID=A0ACA8R6N2_METAZ|nr:hypothetical protein [Methanobrevibacter arboriphilus]BBL62392.1 hypothetical protein MarbSA_14320 [Methanobrevibacter arboriphilus]
MPSLENNIRNLKWDTEHQKERIDSYEDTIRDLREQIGILEKENDKLKFQLMENDHFKGYMKQFLGINETKENTGE